MRRVSITIPEEIYKDGKMRAVDSSLDKYFSNVVILYYETMLNKSHVLTEIQGAKKVITAYKKEMADLKRQEVEISRKKEQARDNIRKLEQYIKDFEIDKEAEERNQHLAKYITVINRALIESGYDKESVMENYKTTISEITKLNASFDLEAHINLLKKYNF